MQNGKAEKICHSSVKLMLPFFFTGYTNQCRNTKRDLHTETKSSDNEMLQQTAIVYLLSLFF